MIAEIKSIPEMLAFSKKLRSEGKTIGFVPTMGALHEGHQGLIQRAKRENDFVVVSVFVNPLQFGANEDFSRYPRDYSGDLKKIEQAGGDLLFTSTPEEMYPKNFSNYVVPEGISSQFEGTVRPGHFRGVATVVLKLFQIVKPNRAYFGRKDAQQLAIIQKMVTDLHLDLEIVPCKTLRTKDGLALSSRNAYLSQEEAQTALALNKALQAADRTFRGGEREAGRLLAAAGIVLKSATGLQIDYLALVDPESWTVCMGRIERGLLLVAARIGKTRLIDNIRLGEEEE